MTPHPLTPFSSFLTNHRILEPTCPIFYPVYDMYLDRSNTLKFSIVTCVITDGIVLGSCYEAGAKVQHKFDHLNFLLSRRFRRPTFRVKTVPRSPPLLTWAVSLVVKVRPFPAPLCFPHPHGTPPTSVLKEGWVLADPAENSHGKKWQSAVACSWGSSGFSVPVETPSQQVCQLQSDPNERSKPPSQIFQRLD